LVHLSSKSFLISFFLMGLRSHRNGADEGSGVGLAVGVVGLAAPAGSVSGTVSDILPRLSLKKFLRVNLFL
jgi:hypothetical protein